MGDYPYMAEYAASGRAGCRWCRELIPHGSLRLAAMVKSKYHDGKDPYWYHHKCFFAKYRFLDLAEIHNFFQLKSEDQQLVRQYLTGQTSPNPECNPGRKNIPQKSGISGIVNSGDFGVEYARSNQSHCVSCLGRIAQGEVRVSQKDYTTERALNIRNGCIDRWHHVQCFIQNRQRLEFFRSACSLAGFMGLKKLDRDFLSEGLPQIPFKRKVKGAQGKENNSESSPKNSINFQEEELQKKTIIEQNERIASIKKALVANSLNTSENLCLLLKYNNQEIPVGLALMLERVADTMLFGALEPCQKCKGQFVLWKNIIYHCSGYVSEFIKCTNKTTDPVRTPFKIPEELMTNPYLKTFFFVLRKRTIISRKEDSQDVFNEPPKKLPKIDRLPLYKRKFIISDQIEKEKRQDLGRQIEGFGGKLQLKLTNTIFAIVSTMDEVENLSPRIKYSKEHCIPVVSEDFIRHVKEIDFSLADAMNKTALCNWMINLQTTN